MESWRRLWSPRSNMSRSRGKRVKPVRSADLVRGPVFGAVRNGPAGQPFRQQLHVLASTATDEPAELFGCERKTWIIIDRAPQPRAEEPSNQASQPPHVNSLAPATNLSVRILFLPRDRDCKRPLTAPHQNFGERIISSPPRQSARRVSRPAASVGRRANRRSRHSARNRRCPLDRSERRWRQSCRRDTPSQRRS